MNTDAIRRLIGLAREARASLEYDEHVTLSIDLDCATADAEAELVALEAAMVGKVLVNIEELRKLEWIIDQEALDGTHGFCEVCCRVDSDGHKDDCWLGNILKEKS